MSRRTRALITAALVGGAAWNVAEAFALRRRRAQVPVLPAAPATGTDTVRGKVDLLAAAGVEVDDQTLAAAAGELESAGVEVIDLVPADLPAEAAIRLLRRVRPERLGEDVLYEPGGAAEAVLVGPSVARRMAHLAVDGPDRATLLGLTMKAQRYASADAAAIRVAPGLRAGRRTALDRWRELEVVTRMGMPYFRLSSLLAGAELAHVVALAAGVAVAPVPGALALAAWSAKPLLALAGGPGALAPPDVVAASLLRLPRTAVSGVATAVAGHREIRSERARRGDHVEPAAPPEHERFEARRDTCPWCGSGDIALLNEMGDFYQQKPGVFRLDRCGGCGHVFQNPALTLAGLDYYYDSFYDGVGETMSYTMFASLARNDLQRIEAIAAVTEPGSWLDVGTGHGHLPARARKRWPSARFDGLDMGTSVEEAHRRGAIDHAYHGRFDEVGARVPHSYDVVSMHHYLEHTRDVRRELDAIPQVLAPGGHLMIEVPDPESPWARRLGTWYWQWSQPEHQHFVPCRNMIRELEDRGYEILSVQRGPATLSGEFLTAAVIAVQSVSRSPHLPWLPPATLAERITRAGALAVGIPFIAAGLTADLIKDADPSPDSIGNAYRIVARSPQK